MHYYIVVSTLHEGTMNRFKVVSALLRAAGHSSEAAYYDLLVYHAHTGLPQLTRDDYAQLMGLSSPRIYQLHKRLEAYDLVKRGEGKDRRTVYVSDIPDQSLLHEIPGWAESDAKSAAKNLPVELGRMVSETVIEPNQEGLEQIKLCGDEECEECGHHLFERAVSHSMSTKVDIKFEELTLNFPVAEAEDLGRSAMRILGASYYISASIFDAEKILGFTPDLDVNFDSPNVKHYPVRVYGFGTDLASRAPACAQLNYSNTNKYKVYTNVYTSYLLLSTRKTETIRTYFVYTLAQPSADLAKGLATPTEKKKKGVVWKKQPREANSMAFKWRRAEDLPEDTEYFETVKSIVDTWNATLGSEPLRLTGANYALVRRMLKEAGVSADTVRRAIAALPGDKYWANQPNRFVRIFNNPSAVQNLGNAEHDRFGIHSARARDFFSDEEQPYVQADAPSEEELWADFDKQYKLR